MTVGRLIEVGKYALSYEYQPTDPLSLRERVGVRVSDDCSAADKGRQICAQLRIPTNRPPLPQGEGWGEGERCLYAADRGRQICAQLRIPTNRPPLPQGEGWGEGEMPNPISPGNPTTEPRPQHPAPPTQNPQRSPASAVRPDTPDPAGPTPPSSQSAWLHLYRPQDYPRQT